MSVTTGVLTTYGRDVLAGALFSDGVALPSLWVGLLLMSPEIGDTGDTVEEVPSAIIDATTLEQISTGYSRIHVPSSSSTEIGLWVQGGNGVLVYPPELRFGEALTNWGYIAAWGLFTESSGGQLFAAGPAKFDVLGPGVPVDEDDVPTGDVVVIPERGIKLGVSGG
jgi:hypothetical protein